ncbi:hypothetical protein ACFSBZ_12805 [Amnibacterium flavum]|uniref:D-inositol 3-phosphate glycosyltransferase n=1 Tax=Amnibacterium flavum TaxID=2173173 RepID=A0A2V1HSR4_9MICO|nr:hypothetical protein [Amnibacterium flavum]PVZ95656.1 hypothetical protein DDQ50_04015 [Amnibacterium flavum]
MKPPLHVTIGADTHGVTRYALAVAAGVGAPVVRLTDIAELHGAAGVTGDPIHLHFTDRLFGASPEDAAATVVALAASRPTTVTLHDLPQPSDGPRNEPRRSAAYRAVAQAARGVVVSSRHEAALLESIGVTGAQVIELPVERPASGTPTIGPRPAAVGVLGFIYPGKGHREVIEAVAGLDVVSSVTALGAASPGHDRDVDALRRLADANGVEFEVTGYLDDDELMSRASSVAVPVAAHRHVSASGSMVSWLEAGRRPIVLAGRYTREMAQLRPGTLSLVDPDGLARAIGAAVEDPSLTRLAAGIDLRPHLPDTAERYLRWWHDAVHA